MSRGTIDLGTKKSVHINLSTETHSALRIVCFKYKITMQDLFDHFAQLIATDDTDAITIIDDLAVKKKKKSGHDISVVDVDSIFALIEQEKPEKARR
jgi:hypothetical protein